MKDSPSRRRAPLVALVIWSVAATVALVICVIGIANANNAATSGASIDQIAGFYSFGTSVDGPANPTQLSIGLTRNGSAKFVFGNNIGQTDSKPTLSGTVKRTSAPNVFRLYSKAGSPIGYLFYQPGVTTHATRTVTLATDEGETLMSRQSEVPLGDV